MDRKIHTPFNAQFYIVLTIIIVLVVAVVLPNLLRSRRHSSADACIANMKQLAGARDQALLVGATAITSPILSPRPADPLVPLMGHNTDLVITNKVSR